MALTRIETAFCVLHYAQTKSNRTVQYAFLTEFSKKATNSNANLDLAKKFKEKPVCVGQTDLKTSISG